MDSDHHQIYCEDTRINEDKPIYVGKRVWIGMCSRIFKGSNIPNNCVIAANSTITERLK